MRKKIVRGTSSRKSNATPTAKRPLQIAKETIRTLSSDELTNAAGGQAAALVCPWNTASTREPSDPGTGGVR